MDDEIYQQGDPVPDETGASGVNKTTAKQVIDPAVAADAKSILSTVVPRGTGHLAQTGDPTWGKTGTTDDNGDAWFCGATPGDHRLRVGWVPRHGDPDGDRVRRRPGRRRDLPGPDLLPSRRAYDSVRPRTTTTSEEAEATADPAVDGTTPSTPPSATTPADRRRAERAPGAAEPAPPSRSRRRRAGRRPAAAAPRRRRRRQRAAASPG